MHLRGKKKKLCPGGGGIRTSNTDRLSLEYKDRITLLSAPITHIMKSAVGGIRVHTSHATPGSVVAPPKGWNYRYTPLLLVCAVLGLEPRALHLLGKHSCQWSLILGLGSMMSLIPCA